MATPQELSGLRVNFKDIAPSTPTLMKFDMAAPTANVAGSVAHSFQGYTPADFSGIGKGISKAIADYKDESEAVYLTEPEMQAFMKDNPDLASKFTPVNTTDEQGNQITKFRLDSTGNKAPDPYASLKAQVTEQTIAEKKAKNENTAKQQQDSLAAQISALRQLRDASPEAYAKRVQELGGDENALQAKLDAARGTAQSPAPDATAPAPAQAPTAYRFQGKEWVPDPNGKQLIPIQGPNGIENVPMMPKPSNTVLKK